MKDCKIGSICSHCVSCRTHTLPRFSNSRMLRRSLFLLPTDLFQSGTFLCGSRNHTRTKIAWRECRWNWRLEAASEIAATEDESAGRFVSTMLSNVPSSQLGQNSFHKLAPPARLTDEITIIPGICRKKATRDPVFS